MSNQRVPRWLTEGISVYEEKRARAGVGPRDGPRRSPAMLNRGEDDQAARPERGVPRTRRRSRSRTSRRRCSSSTSSTAYGEAGAAQAGARLRPGARHRRGAQGGAEHRLRPAAGRLRSDASSASSARCARRSRCPTDEELLRDADSTSCRRWPPTNPRSFPVQMALGRALRKDGKRRRGDAGVRARRGSSCRWPAARTARTIRSPRSRSRRRITPRAIAALQALVAVDFDNVEAARAARRRCCARPRSTDPAKLRAGVRADRRDRSVRRRGAHACSAAWRCSATTPTTAAREFRTVARARAGRPRGGPHRSRRELLQGRQARRGEEADAGRARNRARATSARRTCC